ncbi:DUF72 domain-containing protein [Candidatus Nitrosarchaeum limnium]|jgi:uncharacterized protein YecE (DUF72 family)|uniref:DUF72 domain-containing protein n=1 Tax=Candidatus Nitrosarchaeum limnium BG20 TaxID=859192 RepID=S2E9Q4_9ARCH|nr:DUF72 domain-containing protein [Candidatus Nitrosarchaeum limnium]EPA06101.1 hypothetical protein BG20_I1778 [Candidatus Nitrosarchaeum limnium BG20]
MEIKIGCTGWSYDGWSGTFYPKRLEKTDWLKYYSSIFEITEINSTYYKIPDQSITKKWNADTPDSFRFTAKFPSIITHDHKLKNVQDHVFKFLASLIPLHEKILALVLQLPPSLTFAEAKPRLLELFSVLPEDFKYPIEGRHESWFTDEATDYLKANNHCLVWNEIAGVNNPAPITSDYVYVRLIGDRSIPDKDFGKIIINRKDLIQKWSDKIKNLRNVNSALVLANNHFEGFGPATVNSLRMNLGMSELIWESKKQKTLDF